MIRSDNNNKSVMFSPIIRSDQMVFTENANLNVNDSRVLDMISDMKYRFICNDGRNIKSGIK